MEGKSSPYILAVKFRAKPPALYSPSQITLRSESANDIVSKQIIISRETGAPDFRVTGVSVGTNYLRADLEEIPNPTVGKNGKWVVLVSTKLPLPAQRVDAMVFLESSNPELELPPIPVILLPPDSAAAK